MGELDAIKTFVKGLVKESVDEALATSMPKYLEKKVERFYSVEEACQMLKIKKTAFYDRIKSGTVRTVKKGTARLVYADDLDALLESNGAGKYVHYRRLK